MEVSRLGDFCVGNMKQVFGGLIRLINLIRKSGSRDVKTDLGVLWEFPGCPRHPGLVLGSQAVREGVPDFQDSRSWPV